LTVCCFYNLEADVIHFSVVNAIATPPCLAMVANERCFETVNDTHWPACEGSL
jgi:hypothetical protein